MAAYRLTSAAADDIATIFLEGLEQFGLVQADRYHDGLAERFAFLAEYPHAARERHELTPPVRIHPYRAHLIVYEPAPNGGVLILRVCHSREDWLTDMTD
jgi:toxin ParE1/3/4